MIRRRPAGLPVAVVGAVVVVMAMAAMVAAPPPRAGAHQSDPSTGARLESFVVQFAETADLTGAYTVDDPFERTAAVVEALRRTARRSQRAVQARLRAKGYEFRSLWISNDLWVHAPRAEVEALLELPEVGHVLVEPETRTRRSPAPPVDPPGAGPLWNIAATGAPVAWATDVDGRGIVVASLDSGVDVAHPALAGRWREDHGWVDTTGTCSRPCDPTGHGTHTIATVLGRTPGGASIGMAPGARFVAVRVCDDECRLADVILGMQWIIAPTDARGVPDPRSRPDIVNASWTRERLDESLVQALAALDAAGVEMVFAVGNSGPACGSNAAPGEMASAFAVGSTDRSGRITPTSSRGPTSHGGTNPQVVAPGADIVSARAGGGYAVQSGTSMAAPHVTGALALLFAAHPHLRSTRLGLGILERSAHPVTDDTCGPSPGAVPNNVYGAGQLDVGAALALAAEIDR